MLTARVLSLMVLMALFLPAASDAACTDPSEPGLIVRSLGDFVVKGSEEIALDVTVIGRNGKAIPTMVRLSDNFALRPTNDPNVFVMQQWCDGSRWQTIDPVEVTLTETPAFVLQNSELPAPVIAEQGDTWSSIAKREGVSANDLMQQNGGTRSVVIPGEFIYVNPDATLYKWLIVNGAPAKGTPLEEQFARFNELPDYVKDVLHSYVETKMTPDTIMLHSDPDSPLELNGLAMARGVVWEGRVLCLWHEKRVVDDALQLGPVITDLEAYRYPPIDHEGFRYYLLVIEECGNAAYMKYQLQEPTFRTPTPPPPPPPPTVARRVPPTTTPYNQPPDISRYWTRSTVAWAIGEHVRAHDEQWNAFSGVEHIEWLPNPRFGVVGRLSVNRLDPTWAGHARLGARVKWWEGEHHSFQVEAGGFDELDQMQFTLPDWSVEEAYKNDTGWYVRLPNYLTSFVVLDGVYLNGHDQTIKQAEVTAEPWLAYLHGSWSMVERDRLTHTFDGVEGSIPENVFRIWEVRAGPELFDRHLTLYASRGFWDYDSWLANRSQQYVFDWEHWGAGAIWWQNDHVHVIADWKHVTMEDKDYVGMKRYEAKQDRYMAGVVVNF